MFSRATRRRPAAPGRKPRNLETTRVGRKYLAEVREAYGLVRVFIAEHGANPRKVKKSSRFANQWLVKYIQLLHDRPGGTLKDARYAVPGVQTVHRHLKGRLRRAPRSSPRGLARCCSWLSPRVSLGAHAPSTQRLNKG